MRWFWMAPKADRDLERRVEKLEDEWKKISMEWEEWFDKFRRLYARIAKRAEYVERAENPADGADVPRRTGSSMPASPDSPISLDSRARSLNDAILARRGRRGNAVPNGQG
jgi:hypothetical protein